LRELERTVSCLLELYPDDRQFWQAFSLAAATFFDGLDPLERPWLHARIDAALALHGMVGISGVMCSSIEVAGGAVVRSTSEAVAILSGERA
jgi:hypothetical protein